MPMSPGSTRQGASDADPLVLEDIRPEDFERFLWVFYNPRYSLYDAKVDDWSVILTLSHRWGFAEVKALAVRELEKKEFSSIDRIVFYQTCEVDRNLLIPHFAAICARESPLTLAEGLKLGMETTLVIASAREYIRAIPHPNGLRSPTTPTVEGEELYDMIRELFNIPRVRKADPAPTKDDAKPSTSNSSSAADFHATSTSTSSSSDAASGAPSSLSASASVAAEAAARSRNAASSAAASGQDGGAAATPNGRAAPNGALQNGAAAGANGQAYHLNGSAATNGDWGRLFDTNRINGGGAEGAAKGENEVGQAEEGAGGDGGFERPNSPSPPGKRAKKPRK